MPLFSFQLPKGFYPHVLTILHYYESPRVPGEPAPFPTCYITSLHSLLGQKMPPAPISEPLPSDVSRGSDLLVVTWLTVSLAFLFVALRFYVRGIHRGNLGWDDFTIWIAVVSYLPSGRS